MSEGAAHTAIEDVARNSYGRLIAFLAARSGDVSGAEDALSDAFLSALVHWPERGIPAKPEAWLLHAARNRVIDAARHRQVHEASEAILQHTIEEAQAVADAKDDFPDERLKLLFICAHPAMDNAARTPLMLQTVLGVDAARVASAFLASPTAMGQRLVRAKLKIRAAGIAFSVPSPIEWNERVAFVLDAIYSAYTAGWDSLTEIGSTYHALSTDALSLGRTLVQLMPEEPEARGLLALMLHCEARKDARFSKTGEFVPLDQQDPHLWLQPLIEEAEGHLHIASGYRKLGRYQLEAAIQSIHAHRAVTGRIDWSEIVLLYEGLSRIAASIGAQVGRAVALAQADRPTLGLAALDEIPADRVKSYQPYWAARGHLLQLLARYDEAQAAFTRAASLTDDPALRAHLFKKSQTDLS
jgi:RNA polymerase sigma-70 factor (ECF subfamily)